MTTQRPIAVVVIATWRGLGTASAESHVLLSLSGKPILHHVLDNVSRLQPTKTFLVVGIQAKRVIATLEDRENIQIVHFDNQRGTGHILQQLMPLLEDFEGDLIVMDGSMPLLHPLRVRSLVGSHRFTAASATIMTSLSIDQKADDHHFYSYAEDKTYHLTALRHHTAAERKEGDINVGVSCFRWPDLIAFLQAETLDNDADVHDLHKLMSSTNHVEHHCVLAYDETCRIRGHKALAAAHKILQKRRRDWWMTRGVMILDPDSVTIDETVVLGEDVIIEPQTHLRGKTTIGDGCCIGPGTLVENSQIGARCKVRFSVVSDSAVGNETWVGPYTHLRANAQLGEGCRVGNFVEIKNASLGNSTFAAHLSYLGDAELGNNVNIGAGTVTANYDGIKKHKTMIHDGAKTGANSVLVAPITIGSRVTVAAGSTVTEDVGDEALVVARTRQVVKTDWKPKRK